MRKTIKATLLVTLFALVGQVVAFATQVVTASLFGAGADMDAFLAASAVPQYLIAILIGSLGFVFVPVFVDYLSTGREDEAWELASSMINLSLLVLAVLIALGVMIPDAILSLIAPGLPDATHRQAAHIAMIIWPSVLATGIVSLMTGIYQSQSRFGWPAAVPVIGAMVNLVLLIALANWLGIIGLAIATTLGVVLQVGLLLPLALTRGHYRLTLNWRHAAVQQVLRLLMPLVLANVVGKCTPLIDRALASAMPEGSISRLGYAFRIFSVLVLLFSTGITTVIFPRMAFHIAESDLAGFRRTISSGLRFMWLAIAPVIALGIALALPIVTAVFKRGRFSATDAAVVAGLLQVYLLALASACLGNVTGRGFYVLKDTRILALLGSIESVTYVFYTIALARLWGVVGIAIGYVVLFNGSLAWQALILRHKSGRTGGRKVISSFLRTGLAATLGGAAALGVTTAIANIWLQLVLGGSIGLGVYGVTLYGLGSVEARAITKSIIERISLKNRPNFAALG
jgi:putative peptidoglycan lipid II flippase